LYLPTKKRPETRFKITQVDFVKKKEELKD
jgi:hypothetical protein